jgi:outer membrane protein insertion porin family
LLWLTTFAASQIRPAIPAADRKLIAISATGSQRFTPQEIAAASGLMLGAIAADEDFRKAARQLGETGAFRDIAFNYSYSSAGTKLAFQVADADKFVPARFLDFVWFSDHDLLQKLHDHIPLFHGELPVSGSLPDQVSDVLQALLVEAAIPGHVDYLRTEAKDGALASIDYAVANVSIRVDHVIFTGATGPELSQLQSAAEKLSSREYSHALLNAFIDRVVLPAYREHGYLKAACSAPQPKVVNPNDAPPSADPRDERRAITHIDVILALTPGLQYKVSGWSWSGNQSIPSETLQPLLHTKPGEPANTIQLENDLRSIQQLYGSRGFVTTTLKADVAYDDSGPSVAYQIQVTEGPLFHMGELAFRGIDNNLEARLRAAWKLRPGEIYDSTYLKEFLPKARKLLPPTIDWEVSSHVTAILKDKTVDVDLQYSAKAPQ